jgi:hypothetical protein
MLVLLMSSDPTRRRGVVTASHAHDQGSTGRIEDTGGHLLARVTEHAHGLLDDGVVGSGQEKDPQDEAEDEDE